MLRKQTRKHASTPSKHADTQAPKHASTVSTQARQHAKHAIYQACFAHGVFNLVRIEL